jgi:hypothetical protein
MGGEYRDGEYVSEQEVINEASIMLLSLFGVFVLGSIVYALSELYLWSWLAYTLTLGGAAIAFYIEKYIAALVAIIVVHYLGYLFFFRTEYPENNTNPTQLESSGNQMNDSNPSKLKSSGNHNGFKNINILFYRWLIEIFSIKYYS